MITKAERDALRRIVDGGRTIGPHDGRALLDALDEMERERDEARANHANVVALKRAQEAFKDEAYARAEAAERREAVYVADAQRYLGLLAEVERLRAALRRLVQKMRGLGDGDDPWLFMSTSAWGGMSDEERAACLTADDVRVARAALADVEGGTRE